ncbi:flagellar export chaperone FlgN [Pelagibaculum spongiae]|uniref:Uncharacterized protein n=1 Tax=Pelagibaculum spongiae TaxID=2080658 RepID=A0A2V1GR96_9GAMM|nr:flagellar export chaperone FlgN [Pelagibaculum spongiae]PVZ66752.1 hypothetical protein DC094_15915 [Pelagibaculum spongiae]
MIEALNNLKYRVEVWLKLLQQQNAILTAASSSDLEQITRKVSQHTEALEKDIANLFASGNPTLAEKDTAAANLWLELKENLIECQKLITVNGNIARLANASLSRSIDLITGNTHNTSYSRSGQLTRNRNATYNHSA